jgi:NAD-dependent dihydropyrimidine dehydrogenase PreA subunit
MKILSGIPGLVDEKGNLAADVDTGRTEVPGVFAAGDLLTGTDIAIRAIAGGKHAARAALAYMEGRAYQRPKEFLSKKGDFKEPVAADFADTPRAPRARPVVMEPERRKRIFDEIEGTLAAEDARAESERCLECGCQDVRDCALKQHATEYDAVAKRFLGEVAIHPIDDSHPFIARDPSKCILCGRCIRICLDVQGIGVFGYIYRGFASVVAPSFGIPFGEDQTCISCGQCVSSCPVGALTEKLPAKKDVPLLEKTVEGTCARCSVGCGVDYRWHGSLFTRITERYEMPNNGKLCKKGKFGHEFLNDPVPDAVDLREAKARLDAALAKSRSPMMRISPYLSGEAIDAFVEAATRRGIPVSAAGLEHVDTRWGQLASAQPPGGTDEPGQLIVLIGDISNTNNVAFTEAYRRRRKGTADLWIAGHDDETSLRTASRVFADIQAALTEALAVGSPVEAWVNPEAAPAGALDALLAVREKLAIHLLWNSRNAGYLFACQTPARKSPDLFLDVGVEEATNGIRRIAWGKKQGDEEVFIPLQRELWIQGRSHPTGMPSSTSGAIDLAALKEAAALLS